MAEHQALKPTSVTGTVTWLGVVADSEASLRAQKVEKLDLSYAGQKGECHSGLTFKSCTRTLEQFPRGTEIVNVRQLTILSEEELETIARKMGIVKVDPASLGASMVVRGIPNFTHIPPSSRLQTTRGGTTLVIDMENRPCIYPGRVIEEDHPGHGKAFKKAAWGLRGVTAWVQCAGSVSVGDTLTLHIPDQPAWTHANQHLTQCKNRYSLAFLGIVPLVLATIMLFVLRENILGGSCCST